MSVSTARYISTTDLFSAVADGARQGHDGCAAAGPRSGAISAPWRPWERLYIGSISAAPTACPLRGYGRAGTQNDRLGEGFLTVQGLLPMPAITNMP